MLLDKSINELIKVLSDWATETNDPVLEKLMYEVHEHLNPAPKDPVVLAQEAEEELSHYEYTDGTDIEAAHGAADSIVEQFIRDLGYRGVADAYSRVNKSY